jgi:hypothetical protein
LQNAISNTACSIREGLAVFFPIGSCNFRDIKKSQFEIPAIGLIERFWRSG